MTDFSIYAKAWSLLSRREKRNAWLVLIIVLVAALSSAGMIGSVMPFLSVLAEPERIREIAMLSWIYEKGGFQSYYSFLVALGFASLMVIFFANVMQLIRVWAVARYTTRRMHTIGYRLLSSYLRQPYEFFVNRHTSAMSTQILSEAQLVVTQFLAPAAEVIASFLTVLVIVALLIWVNSVVALSAFTLLGGLFICTFLVSRRVIANAGKLRAQSNKERYRIANEALSGAKDIKLLGCEDTYIAEFKRPSSRWASSQVIVQVAGQMPQYVMYVLGFGGMIVLCLFMVDGASLEAGSGLGTILPLLGVFAVAGQRLLPEMSKLYHGLTQLQYGRSAVEAVYDDLVLLTSGEALPDAPNASLSLKRDLRLDRISYRYPEAEVDSLCDISLTVYAGEKIGVVGSTGSGKTTLADLVLGLLSPSEGKLVVDDVSVERNNIRAWRQSVGYVPQEIFLTDASIAKNIAMGVPDSKIDYRKVEDAARAAQIHEFVLKELPDGYDTLVGERGVRLSGGQRQRVGIARAMYHEAEFLVFDEATSALDNATERDVMTAIEDLPGNRTVLIIAHRLTTVQSCDRILVLDSGQVAGIGTWDILRLNNIPFQKLLAAAH